MMKGVYLFCGLGFLALGLIGIFLPILPTTPFLLVAAACFARSSTRLESWLLSHPVFGSLLRDWRERGAIPVRAKYMALGGCAFGFSLLLWGGQASGVGLFAVALLMMFALAYVFTRPDA